MARQRVDATLGALARRRVDLSSAHFGLAYQMREEAVALPAAAALRPGRDRISISAPKRQLKRAVDRNALKRVAREAWRHAPWAACGRPQVMMLKLRRSEPDWKTMGRQALKKAWRAEIDELLARLVRRLPACAAVPAAHAPGAGVDRSPGGASASSDH